MKREIEFQEIDDEQLDQVVGGHGWGHYSRNSYTRQSNSAFVINAPVQLNFSVFGNATGGNQGVTINQNN